MSRDLAKLQAYGDDDDLVDVDEDAAEPYDCEEVHDGDDVDDLSSPTCCTDPEPAAASTEVRSQAATRLASLKPCICMLCYEPLRAGAADIGLRLHCFSWRSSHQCLTRDGLRGCVHGCDTGGGGKLTVGDEITSG